MINVQRGIGKEVIFEEMFVLVNVEKRENNNNNKELFSK